MPFLLRSFCITSPCSRGDQMLATSTSCSRFFTVTRAVVCHTIRASRNENIGALARKLSRVCVFGEITAFLCYFVSKGTCLIPHVPEDIEAGIAKIDVTNFRLGEECLKFLLLMISVADIGWLPGTPWQSCLFKLVQVAFPWALYLCWNIEKPQASMRNPMAILVWAAVRKSTMLELVIIVRTLSILFNWTGSSATRQVEELPR